MKRTIITFFFTLLISPFLQAGSATPEVYGIKFNEVFLCASAECSQGIKIGGGDRINIADPYFTNNIGTLIDLKKANLGDTAYSHVKFNVDMRIVVKANSDSCYTFPTKIEAGYSDGTDDPKKYGEQIIQMDKDYVDCTGCSNVTEDSFDYTHPLDGSYTKGTGQSIVWNVNVANAVQFDGCEIGPDKPYLHFEVVSF